ncbi:ribbon-helix-helix domain-containing protein [Salinarimonas sp.]|uniref:ribbon-helix-helix domain-containing protein n=1 Tax=Salinarimonas sp. TaxID=2766526 RepID=UPI0032D985CD
MSAAIVKRSLSIAGHRTSISLEEPFWEALRALADARGVSVQRLVGEIDAERGAANLSSAIRVRLFEAARAGELSRGDAAPGPETERVSASA